MHAQIDCRAPMAERIRGASEPGSQFEGGERGGALLRQLGRHHSGSGRDSG
jgi:hypothetical protein